MPHLDGGRIGTLGPSGVSEGPSPIDTFLQHRYEAGFQKYAAQGNGRRPSATMGCLTVQPESPMTNQSSMVPNGISRGSLSSSNVPDLVGLSPVSQKDSGSSVESREDIHRIPHQHYILELQDDGNMAAPGGGEMKLECLMNPICKNKANPRKWMLDSRTHFGCKPPPPDAICPFCNFQFHDPDGIACWTALMHHVREHYREDPGITLEHSPPDYNLYRYLFDHGLLRKEAFDMVLSKNTVEPLPGERIWGNIDPSQLRYSVHTEAPAAHVPTPERRREYRRASRR